MPHFECGAFDRSATSPRGRARGFAKNPAGRGGYVTKRPGRDKAGGRAAPSPRLRGEGWGEGRNRCRPGNLQKPLTRPRFARSPSPRRRGEVKRAIRTDRVLAAPRHERPDFYSAAARRGGFRAVRFARK